MSRTLYLTQDQLEVLFDSLQEEMYQLQDALNGTDLTLNDYEIHKVFLKVKKMRDNNATK
tara:strand:+ start:178 stop:357 length:180 start_codon:yes stop_codon:yes gene_type:complete